MARILNAFAGIGGNRKNWSNRHDIVAVEKNSEIAEVYRELYPGDEVKEVDAYEFIESFHADFDFIWASPPCATHSSIRRAGARNNQYEDKLPDFRLYALIEFLDTYFDGDYVVENVAKTWYEPLIEPQKRGRHYFWSNFVVPEFSVGTQGIHFGGVEDLQEYLGIDLSGFVFESVEKRKVLRNAVHPRIGERVLSGRGVRQSSLGEL